MGGLPAHQDRRELKRQIVLLRRELKPAIRRLGRPETFDFLGLTHIRGKTRKGHFMLNQGKSQAR